MAGGTRRGDRAAGAVVLLVSAAYWWEAGRLASGFGDPLGPAAFPRLIAVPTGLLALFLILRPDPDARWWHGRQSVAQLLALAALLAVPILIEPLGFPLTATIAAAALAVLFGAGPLAALLTGLAVGFGLFAAFDALLGLPLPGWPDAL